MEGDEYHLVFDRDCAEIEETWRIIKKRRSGWVDVCLVKRKETWDDDSINIIEYEVCPERTYKGRIQSDITDFLPMVGKCIAIDKGGWRACLMRFVK